jgi:hypothetical protein
VPARIEAVETTMSILLIAAMAVLAMSALWLGRRRRVGAVLAGSPRAPRLPLPRRVTNPRLLGDEAPAIWVLRACPQCELTYRFNGRLFAAEDAIPLPMPGCLLTRCQCRYEPAGDRRRGDRREGADRRDALRFEARADRRAWRNRRGDDPWSAPGVR